MPSLNVTFELVTPAFAGAADRSKTDGLRPPALKSLLRFWWRTMYGDHDAAKISEFEGVFGSQSPTVGQRLRLIPLRDPKPGAFDAIGTARNQNDIKYTYMGYGPVQRVGGVFQLTVPEVKEGYTLDARLYWPQRPLGAEDFWTEEDLRAWAAAEEQGFVNSLWLLSAFGGYGGRSRRGWGSILVRGSEIEASWAKSKLVDPHSCSTRDGLVQALRAGLRIVAPGELSKPVHTAFSSGTRVLVGFPKPDWQQALGSATTLFERYRRALGGRHKHLPGCVGPDHKTRSSWLSSPPVATDRAPSGAAFGLPLNAKFSATGKKVNVNGRRASPVLFKILKCGAQRVPIVVYLPSQFSKDGSVKVEIDGIPGTRSVLDPDGGAIVRFFTGDPGVTCYDLDPPAPWKGLIAEGWTEL